MSSWEELKSLTYRIFLKIPTTFHTLYLPGDGDWIPIWARCLIDKSVVHIDWNKMKILPMLVDANIANLLLLLLMLLLHTKAESFQHYEGIRLLTVY